MGRLRRRRATILGMPETTPNPRNADRATSADGFRRGLSLGLPILLGYLPVGMAFGVLARDMGFSVLDAVICSATALAGAGQFIALSLLSAGATPLATVAATAVVNLRYLLFSTTLSPRMRGTSLPLRSWLAFTVTDETFAINIADAQTGSATPGSMAGVGLVSWIGWVVGTAVGALGAQGIGDPSAWGIDFAMPAMFSALFVALAQDRTHVAVGVLAGAVVIGLALLGRIGVTVPSTWFVMTSSLAAATVASVVIRER